MSPAFHMDMRRYHNDLIINLGETNELPYYSTNSEIIRRGIKEGIFRKEIDVEITNKCIVEVARISNDPELFPPEDFLRKDVIRNVYLNYLRGISTQKGLDLIDYYDKKQA